MSLQSILTFVLSVDVPEPGNHRVCKFYLSAVALLTTLGYTLWGFFHYQSMW